MRIEEPHQAVTNRFAWDGFSLPVPHDWNLSDYSLRRDVSRIEMEDDKAVRLEMEWMRTRTPIKRSTLQKRCARVARDLTEAGAESAVVDDLPDGWTAVMYSMPDGKYLLTAYRLMPGCPFFCLLQLHFQSASRREPPRMIRQIASGFQIHEKGPIPWEFYDIAFRVNREFKLVNTSFHAGRKLMAFEWRLRRLHIWFFSLADTVLKQKPLEEWCAEFLNGFKGIQGPRFIPGRQGEILTRFSFRYPFGQFEEILRWCFRYRVRCMHVPEKNRIVLYVFNYRKDADLAKLAMDLSPSQEAPTGRRECGLSFSSA